VFILYSQPDSGCNTTTESQEGTLSSCCVAMLLTDHASADDVGCQVGVEGPLGRSKAKHRKLLKPAAHGGQAVLQAGQHTSSVESTPSQRPCAF